MLPNHPKYKLNQQRAAVMAKRYRNGETFESISDSYGLSRQRIQQILSKEFNISKKDGGANRGGRIRIAIKNAAREAKTQEKIGCSHGEYREMIQHGNRMREQGAHRDTTPLGAFYRQKHNAGLRGIDWNMKFWDWWMLWQNSGHWDKRGRSHDCYVMGRNGDTGPYKIDNVSIISVRENCSTGGGKIREYPIGVRKHVDGHFSARRKIDGVYYTLGPFQTAGGASYAIDNFKP